MNNRAKSLLFFALLASTLALGQDLETLEPDIASLASR